MVKISRVSHKINYVMSGESQKSLGWSSNFSATVLTAKHDQCFSGEKKLIAVFATENIVTVLALEDAIILFAGKNTIIV